MNAKLNLLEDMAQVLATPRTQSNTLSRTTPVKVRLRPSPPAPRVARRPAAQPLWRISLEVARETLAERLLTWTLFAAAGTSLIWLGFTLLQFLFAWSHLVTWVRSAMI